ncbi:MAG: helix-turn-helix domain-containing protein [Planctomycetaceae bacterium]
MSKKYLSLDEAAQKIGINPAELNRLREKGTIRAFADRGNWKFKEEDVLSLARSRQADSDPDVPLQLGTSDDDSSAELVFSDEELGIEPTVVAKGGLSDSSSDSDVRLIFDDGLNVPDSKKGASEEDSDSDVKLAGSTTTPSPDTGSDSDVKLVGDADAPTPTGSDSDVRLVSSDSSGEVKMAGGPDSSTIRKKKEGSSGDVAAVKEDDESGISLASGSGIALDRGDDSGIALAGDSGIALASDSGISLEQPNDSGISLSEESSIVLADDSGISLAPEGPVKRGGKQGAKSPGDSDDLTGTIPLMDIAGDESEDILDTQMEVPMLGDSSDEAGVVGGDRGNTTSVITLDEDEDEYSVSGTKKPGDSGDDLFGGEEAVAVEDEEVDVAEEVVGEDDELSEDVFGAEDEDFAEEVESGESVSELPIAPRGLVAAEQDWGTGTFVGLAVSTLLMVLCGTVMFDMVRSMWHTDSAGGNPVASGLLELFKNI